jgi:hypothetical protein
MWLTPKENEKLVRRLADLTYIGRFQFGRLAVIVINLPNEIGSKQIQIETTATKISPQEKSNTWGGYTRFNDYLSPAVVFHLNSIFHRSE